MASVSIRGERISVAGDLTVDTASVLYYSTPAFDQPHYTVDLEQVEKCDSAGLSLLVHWHSRAARSEAILEFSNVPGNLLEIAQLGGLGEIFRAADIQD